MDRRCVVTDRTRAREQLEACRARFAARGLDADAIINQAAKNLRHWRENPQPWDASAVAPNASGDDGDWTELAIAFDRCIQPSPVAHASCVGYVYVGTATLPCPECHPEHWEPGTTRASLGYPPHEEP